MKNPKQVIKNFLFGYIALLFVLRLVSCSQTVNQPELTHGHTDVIAAVQR